MSVNSFQGPKKWIIVRGTCLRFKKPEAPNLRPRFLQGLALTECAPRLCDKRVWSEEEEEEERGSSAV